MTRRDRRSAWLRLVVGVAFATLLTYGLASVIWGAVHGLADLLVLLSRRG